MMTEQRSPSAAVNVAVAWVPRDSSGRPRDPAKGSRGFEEALERACAVFSASLNEG
jgi:hypothetical protein